jgi:SH3 domain protein
MLRTTLLLSLVLTVVTPVQAVDRYVTDIFEVTMRSGPSTSNAIIRMLPSGEAVTLLEEDLDTKYSFVETADGKQGYVITRFLEDSPVARQVLVELRQSHEQQRQDLEAQAAEIAELKQSLEGEQSDNASLKIALRASEQELSQVREAAQNTLSILEQNKRMQTVVDQLREEKSVLSATNAELSDSTRIDWFVRGAAVSLIAFIIGILVTRIRWRKKDTWGSY